MKMEVENRETLRRHDGGWGLMKLAESIEIFDSTTDGGVRGYPKLLDGGSLGTLERGPLVTLHRGFRASSMEVLSERLHGRLDVSSMEACVKVCVKALDGGSIDRGYGRLSQ